MVRIVQGNKLFLAPIGESPKKVLDVGTGTGIWAIEMVPLEDVSKRVDADLIGRRISLNRNHWN